MDYNRDIQAPWVGKSDWEYYGWKSEEEELAEELAYDEYIDRMIDDKELGLTR